MTTKQVMAADNVWERSALPQEMQFRIKGLRAIGDDTFVLEGVVPTEVGWDEVEGLLVKAGIPKDETLAYVERFARLVERGELARVLAERMERV